uniref:TSG101 and ALIX binding domain-containing protein n=1 Tax=Denticeps clupeoides TaxID=299321 RepID=A0AAY4AFS8_9TELE
MASGAAKKAFASKLGFRSAAASAEQELDKLRRENVRLKETLDDMAKRAGRQDPGSGGFFLFLILTQQSIREHRAPAGSHHDCSKSGESPQKAGLRSLTNEAPSGEIAALQEQLSDALEKNRQWLVYDQQREAFVRGLLARLQELEKPASRANGALQQQHKGGGEKLQAQAELDQLRRRLEEASREAARAQEELDRREDGRQVLAEERQNWAERARHLQAELESANARLEDERRRTAELLQQEQRHQNVQRQLHKMQKELRKAREEIARLDLAKQQRELHVPETGYYDGLDLERLAIEDHPSPSKMPSLLDTSFLECPSCKTQYPASRHSELLAHIEYCYYADA